MAMKLNMIYTKADEALRKYLNNDPDAEYTHGLITAILCNPELVPPHVWFGNLLKIAEGRGNLLDSEKEVEIVSDAIFNLYNYTNNSLKDGSFEPFISPTVELIDLKMTYQWCKGFIFASDSWPDEVMKNSAVQAHLTTIFYFANQNDPEFNDIDKKQIEKLDKYVKDKRENIKNNVLGIYSELAAMKSEPVKKEPKINRNDPCPCGSGKKYKKCCGK